MGVNIHCPAVNKVNLPIRTRTGSCTRTQPSERLKTASTHFKIRVVSRISSGIRNASKQPSYPQPCPSTSTSLIPAYHSRKKHEHPIRANFQSIFRHQTRLYRHLELIRPRHFTDLGFRTRTQVLLRSSNGESQSQARSQ